MNFSSFRPVRAFALIAALLMMFAPATALFAQDLATPDSLIADASEAERQIIASARGLASEGKWLSAWNALTQADPDNLNPWYLAEKVNLALDGYAQTAFHVVFGFVDLAEGQTLEHVRDSGSDEIEPVDFTPDTFAASIEEKGGAMPPALSLALGDYFFTIYRTYQGQWLEDDTTVLSKAAEQYDRAFAYETFTIQSLGNQAEILVALQRFDGAEAVLSKALEYSPEDPGLMASLAETYFGTAQYDKVYPLADKLIAAATTGDDLNNAYVVALKSALTASDKPTLDKYVAGFEAAFAEDYTPVLIRHLVAVRFGDDAGADAAADELTAQYPGDPEIIRSLLSTWLSEGKPEGGFAYLDRSIASQETSEALSALYFYRALMISETALDSSEFAKAIGDLEKAKEYFADVYPADHEVFTMIAELKAEWEANLNPPAETVAVDATATPAATETPVAPAPEASSAAEAPVDAESAASEW